MTANIHPSNLEYYHAVLDNLRAGREHGLQYKYEGEWVDYGTEDSGMPFCNWCIPGFELRMKPEAPAREMLKIGALELPRPEYSFSTEDHFYFIDEAEAQENVSDLLWAGDDSDYLLCEKGLCFGSKDHAEQWADFQQKLRTGDPETIAAITQQAELDELAEELELQLKAYASALARIELLEKQREIDRDALVDAVKDANFKLKGFKQPVHKDFAAAYIAKAVIEHLNAKPVESGELSKVAQNIHYPECWDTVAYPTLMDALREFTCSECANLVERKQLPLDAKCGISRAEWHDKAWELYHNKTFEDLQLSKVNIHTLRTIFNATYDALEPVTQAPKELVMPGWLQNGTNSTPELEGALNGIKALCQASADLFRDRGITLPKDLQK